MSVITSITSERNAILFAIYSSITRHLIWEQITALLDESNYDHVSPEKELKNNCTPLDALGEGPRYRGGVPGLYLNGFVSGLTRTSVVNLKGAPLPFA